MTELEKKRLLMETLTSRKQWEAGGRKPYREQYVWDSYHDSLEPTEDGAFRFSIQIYDSPELDIWWSGECSSINRDTDVKIIRESHLRT